MPVTSPALRAAARATSRTALFAVTAASMLATAPVPAAAAPATSPSVTVASDSSHRSVVDANTASEAQRHRDSASALWQAGELRRARGEFLMAARLLRAAGVLPAGDLQYAAAVDFARGRALDAAATMDQLAADAITFGNPDVQARALLDAMWLYTHGGRTDIARERLATLRPLLASPFVSAGTRTEVAARTNVEVAARSGADAR